MANVVVDNAAPDSNGLTHVRQLRGDGTTVVEAPDGTLTATGGLVQRHDHWVPYGGQTTFPLTASPRGGGVLFFVNGMLQQESGDYSVEATTLTWLNQDFFLGEADSVDAVYAA